MESDIVYWGESWHPEALHVPEGIPEPRGAPEGWPPGEEREGPADPAEDVGSHVVVIDIA